MADGRRLGWYAREWLRHKKKTQADIIRATGWSKGYVSDLVAGKERYNEDVLKAFSDVIGCSPGDLIDVDPTSPTQLLASQLKRIDPADVSAVQRALQGFLKP